MSRSLRAARVATFVYFVLNGTLMGMWLVQIPAIEQRVGISNATLGSLLVLLGLGAFIGMQFAGRLADRIGTRVVVPAAGVLCGAALVLPGLARDPWTLAGALLVFGFGNGCLDVSMNTHAVHVEKAYNRPVMSAFHATFSVGGVIAAIVGAQATSAGMSPATTLGAAGAVGIVIALLPARSLLAPAPTSPAPESTADERLREPGAKRRPVPGRIWILAALAWMCMLCEGVANDWSALEAKHILGAPAATASFAYGTYAATMTIGRLLADRVSRRFGSAAVLRYGAAAGAVGITVVALSPWIWTALAGWALFGLGLSGCVPQLFSAAGHADPDAAGANVSRVAGLGYLGMLAGPALIGWMTRLMALNHTFLLPALLLVIAAATAGILRSGIGREPEPAMAQRPSPPVSPHEWPARRPRSPLSKSIATTERNPMSTGRRIVLFDLFGVVALQQRPGALAEMAACCHAPAYAFTEAYWALRPPYDAARQSAPQYWTAVLRRLSRPVDTGTIEKLRLTDIDSWSRVDDHMVAYAQSLLSRAQVAVLSNIPADHADAFSAAQPWLQNLDHVALSGKINVAKPDPNAFHHCVAAMHATPADFLFIDDREENVRAARAIGMTGHVFTGFDELVQVVNTWLPTSTAAADLIRAATRR